MNRVCHPLRIALFRGAGIISNLIRWQTDGRYSHAAIVLPNGMIIESVGGEGVRARELTDVRGVDIFNVETTPQQAAQIVGWASSQLGEQYDWWAIARFISRRRMPDNDRWFCSELVFEAFARAGVFLLARSVGWEVSPSMLARSPLLKPAIFASLPIVPAFDIPNPKNA